MRKQPWCLEDVCLNAPPVFVFATTITVRSPHLAATVDRSQSAGCCEIPSVSLWWRNWTAVWCPHICVVWEHRTAAITAALVTRVPNNRWVPFTTPCTPLVRSVGQGYVQIDVAAVQLTQVVWRTGMHKSEVGCVRGHEGIWGSGDRALSPGARWKDSPDPTEWGAAPPPHCVCHLFSVLCSLASWASDV